MDIKPPYYAVIFSSRKKNSAEGYEQMAQRMVELGSSMPGFLGIHSARDTEGFGITVSYWRTLDDIKNWKHNEEHMQAQKQGRSEWYDAYEIRICLVQHQYGLGTL